MRALHKYLHSFDYPISAWPRHVATYPDDLVRHLQVAELAKKCDLEHLESLALIKFTSCCEGATTREVMPNDEGTFTRSAKQVVNILYPSERSEIATNAWEPFCKPFVDAMLRDKNKEKNGTEILESLTRNKPEFTWEVAMAYKERVTRFKDIHEGHSEIRRGWALLRL